MMDIWLTLSSAMTELAVHVSASVDSGATDIVTAHYETSAKTTRGALTMIRLIGTIFCMGAGLFFILAGTIGVLRLPDFYTRQHAAGITDTLGAELILFALILQSGMTQMSLKLLLVAFFLFVTSPTSTHAVAHAAYRAGLKPLLGPYRAPSLDEIQDEEGQE